MPQRNKQKSREDIHYAYWPGHGSYMQFQHIGDWRQKDFHKLKDSVAYRWHLSLKQNKASKIQVVPG